MYEYKVIYLISLIANPRRFTSSLSSSVRPGRWKMIDKYWKLCFDSTL